MSKFMSAILAAGVLVLGLTALTPANAQVYTYGCDPYWGCSYPYYRYRPYYPDRYYYGPPAITFGFNYGYAYPYYGHPHPRHKHHHH